MKVLVTGANGYMGTGIVQQLINDGIEVVATDICATNEIGCEFIQSDIFSVENPFHYFGEPDALLHLAWRDGFKHSSDSHIDDLSKHYHFIEKLISEGIKQVCVLGSVHEVGFYEGSVDENTPTRPQSLYGVSKNALRDLTEIKCREKDVIFQWVRGYYIVGNSHKGCSVFSKITEAAEKGDTLFPFTQGKNQFDFLDYETFCKQVASIVEQTEIDGIINACSGYPEKIGERVERFILDNKYSIKLEYGKFPDRPYDSKAVWGNSKKIDTIMRNRSNEC